MSNSFEYKDSIVFHPGYYVKESIEYYGLSQEDYAKRLGTTPKNLSKLIHGEQSLSIDIAMRLSRLTGTSIEYWLNLQKIYDSAIASIKSDKELEEERSVLKELGYDYFKKNFNLPELKRRLDDQVAELRAFLNVSSLTVLRNREMAIRFRSSAKDVSEANTIKANAMVQIATVQALKTESPRFDSEKFSEAISFTLTQTKNHDDFFPLVKKAFRDSGVVFEILPNFPGSKINGATRRIGDRIMLMVNDRYTYSDTFWFSLFHEIGHIKNNDFGISFDQEAGEQEEIANKFAEDSLIPPLLYREFINRGDINPSSIREFSNQIDRDAGIIVGRLQKDNHIRYDDWNYNKLKRQYKISISL